MKLAVFLLLGGCLKICTVQCCSDRVYEGDFNIGTHESK